MKLNLGCGYDKKDGYVNVDNDPYCQPDMVVDLEGTLPWPDSSVDKILMFHVLEHLGQDAKTYLSIWKELYRILKDQAEIKIIVPHHNHEYFHSDPTHCRKITVDGLSLFNQQVNMDSIKLGFSSSTLGLQNLIDVEIVEHSYNYTPDFLSSFSNLNNLQTLKMAQRFNNSIEEVFIKCIIHKPARYKN